MGTYRDNGKQAGNYYLGFRADSPWVVQGLGFRHCVYLRTSVGLMNSGLGFRA